MTLDQVAAMTLDQVCDGKTYPEPTNVRKDIDTGYPVGDPKEKGTLDITADNPLMTAKMGLSL